MKIERILETPCGKVVMPEMFQDEYKLMTNEELEKRINARFVDPFALAEQQARFLEKLMRGSTTNKNK